MSEVEKHGFQTEVKQLLGLLANSLYSNKEKAWVDPQQALGIKLHEGWNGVYYVVKEN